jgi:glycogen debranching enzyme
MVDLSDVSILKKVTAPSGMLYASASANYAFAEFGRDAIEACLDIIPVLPEEVAKPIAFSTIKRLAELQGEQNAEDIIGKKDATELTSEDQAILKQLSLSEERKGKIHHEHRADIVDDTPIPLHAQKILAELSLIWGGSEHQMTYYGSLDATPQFIRLIGLYCEHYGNSVLTSSYQTKSGKTQTIREALYAAIVYIASELQKSSCGLYEMYRINSAGLKNQTWKDSPSAFITTDKTLPNYDNHVIPLSVQGLVFDALHIASELFKDTHQKQATQWMKLARTLQEQTFTQFWMADKAYFATALWQDEYDDSWQKVTTISSDPINLLPTRIFDSCEPKQQELFLTGIVTQLYSDQFLTDVGIRCRAKKHIDLVDYSDYHGVEAVWPKETYDCIVGLRRQGFMRLAEQVGIRLLNGIRIADTFYELFFVTSDNRVSYDPSALHPTQAIREPIYATSVPEDMQTWTITASLAEYQLQTSGIYKNLDIASWQYCYEEKLLPLLPTQTLLQSEEELRKAFPTTYAFTVDLEKGKKRAEKYENLLIHATIH